MNEILFHDIYERAKTSTSLDETANILGSREYENYLLKGVAGLEIIRDGLKIIFKVKEADANLFQRGLPTIEKEFFIPKFVWNHLCNSLGIPSRVFDYYQKFHSLLDKDDFNRCQENESEVLQILFDNRIKDQAKRQAEGSGHYLKDLHITVFNDIFGEFPRRIATDVYYPFKDIETLELVQNGFTSINKNYADRNYRFKDAYISPYQTELHYTNTLTKRPTVRGEEIEAGLTIINSECKKKSLTFQALVLRLTCLNGATSTFKDPDLSIRHYEANFERKVQNGFVKAVKLESEFAKQYLEAVNYNERISDNWADFLDLPRNLLEMKPNERQEIIDIAKQEDYEFTPYGVVQALTFKSTHRAHDDATKERINEKAVHILDNIELLQEWTPKTLQVSS